MLGGRAVNRALFRSEPAGQRHVEEPGAEHVRIAPAAQHLFLSHGQPDAAPAGKLGRLRLCAEPVEAGHAEVGQSLQRRRGRGLAQCKKAG